MKPLRKLQASFFVVALLLVSGLLTWGYWAVSWQRALWSPNPFVAAGVVPVAVGALFAGVLGRVTWGVRGFVTLFSAVPLCFGVLLVRRLPPAPDPAMDLAGVARRGPGVLLQRDTLAIDRSRCGSSAAFHTTGKSGTGSLELFVSCPLTDQPRHDSELWAGLKFTNRRVHTFDLKKRERELLSGLARRADAWLSRPRLAIHGLSPAPSGRELRQWGRAAGAPPPGEEQRTRDFLEVHLAPPRLGAFAFWFLGIFGISITGVLWLFLTAGARRPPGGIEPVVTAPLSRNSDRSQGLDAWRPALALGGTAVIVWLWMSITGVDPFAPTPSDLLGFGAASQGTLSAQPWRLVTHLFVHSGVGHLGANVVGLLIANAALLVKDRAIPHWLAFCTFLFGGIAGGVLTASLNPSVFSGASGGVLALCSLVAGHELIAPSERRLGLKLVAWPLGGTLLLSWLPQVAGWSHIGGTAIGLVFGLGYGCGPSRSPLTDGTVRASQDQG